MSFNVDYIINLRDKASVKLDKLDKKAKKTNSGFMSMAKTAGALFAGAAVAGGIKKIADLGIEMEQTRVAFSTFLGDAGKANKLIADLNEFANVTPFDNAEIIKSSRNLLAAGVSAEGMTDQLRSIGDVAAGANVPITELSAIFAKATNKGKLQAEELNQFSERGIPLLDELSKKFGVSKAEVLKLGSQGKITSDIMNEAFTSMTSEGGIFFNLMAKQSETTGGKISTLIGQLQMIGIQIGEALLPAISAVVDGMLSFIKVIQNNVEIVKTLGVIVLIAAAAWVAYNIPAAIAATQTALLTAAQWALNLALTANPIGIVVVTIAAFITALVVAWRHSETFRGALYGLWEAMKGIGAAVVDLLIKPFAALSEIWDGLSDLFSGNGAEKLISGVKNLGKSILNYILQPFLAVSEIIDGVFGTDVSGSIEKFTGAKSVFANVGEDIGKGVVKSGIVDHFSKGGLGADFSDPNSVASKSSMAGVNSGASTVGKGLNSGIDKVTSSAPKTFNINIENLVESFKIETSNLKESTEQTKDAILQALIGAVNDVSIISK
jgi:tape measure domain-containing protein